MLLMEYNNVSSLLCFLIICSHSSVSKGSGITEKLWKQPPIKSYLHCWNLSIISPLLFAVGISSTDSSFQSLWNQRPMAKFKKNLQIRESYSFNLQFLHRHKALELSAATLHLFNFKTIGNCIEHFFVKYFQCITLLHGENN